MKEIVQTKVIYSSPEVDVVNIATEGPVAASATPAVTITDWTQDTTPPQPYDGDIWFPQ